MDHTDVSSVERKVAGLILSIDERGAVKLAGPRKIMHIITGLDPGGAEMMLYRLVAQTDRAYFETEVVSMTDIGLVGKDIQKLGVPVRSLNMRRGVPNPLALLRLSHWLRRAPPDVIQTWIHEADLIGGLAAMLAGRIPVVWGIHHSNFDSRGTKRRTIWTAAVCARLSRWLPAQIVCCSEASRREHMQLGYTPDKMVVIPNGFDLTVFRPNQTARQSVREELAIPEAAPLIGLFARFNPQKDHRNFIRAAAIFLADLPNCHFLLCGTGITWENPSLVRWIEEADVRDAFHLLGLREDIPRLTAALDIASTSSSYGEAFPIVIGEAMSCGVPCVVTDVGDSADIVGDTGIVVRPGDSHALANGWKRLLQDTSPERRFQIGLAARSRVMEKYNLQAIVKRYEHLYTSLEIAL